MRYILASMCLLLASCGSEPQPAPPAMTEVETASDPVPHPVPVTIPDYRLPEEPHNKEMLKAADGFAFVGKQYSVSEMVIKLVYYDHQSDINKAYQKLNGKLPHVQAFSVFVDGRCEIHMLDPDVAYIPQLAGHELTHCFHGKFHR